MHVCLINAINESVHGYACLRCWGGACLRAFAQGLACAPGKRHTLQRVFPEALPLDLHLLHASLPLYLHRPHTALPLWLYLLHAYLPLWLYLPHAYLPLYLNLSHAPLPL